MNHNGENPLVLGVDYAAKPSKDETTIARGERFVEGEFREI